MRINEEINKRSEGGIAAKPELPDTPEPSAKNSTRLEPINKTHSVVEGLQARVKDPLWLLGKQWQIGGFKARNGGHLVRTELDIKYRPLNNIVWKQEQSENLISEPFDLKVPLEMKVEEEIQVQPDKVRVKGWNSKRLEYEFSLINDDTKLVAEDYFGENLDWFNFDLVSSGVLTETIQSIAVKPSPISYRGMPLPRWWSIEDSSINLGKLQRPELNFLTMLLVEFSLIYSNDWYVIPLEHKLGHLRNIEKFVAMDSFGVVSEVNPVIDKTKNKQGWELFTHSSLSMKGASDSQLKEELSSSDGRIFYLPNRLYHALESEPIEKVNFFRDEMANLVWAVEQKYQDTEGRVINRNDEELENTPVPSELCHYWDVQENRLVEKPMIQSDGEPGKRYIGPVALYQPRTHIPVHWIPYKPLQSNDGGRYGLRRSRTVVDASQIQYRGVFLSESKIVYEEEVPRIGVMLYRVVQMARDSYGTRYSWHSRKKGPDVIHKSSGLRFDALIEK